MRKPSFAHRWQDFEQTQPEQVLAHLKDATIAITNKVKLSGEILAQTPQLKMIAVAATGTDNIDLAYCRAHGIVVSNIRNYAVHTLPEHVFMLMLALRRNLLAWRQDVQMACGSKPINSACSPSRSTIFTAAPRHRRLWRLGQSSAEACRSLRHAGVGG